MKDINLLSNNEKNNIKKIIALFYIKKIFSQVVIVIVIISLTFSLINYLLDKSLETIESDLEREKNFFQDEKILSIEDATKQLNEQIKQASKIQSSYIKWPVNLQQIINSITSGILLSSLKIDGVSKVINFSGKAMTRSDLQNFQKSLKENALFSNVGSATSNILQKENIDFKITCSLTEIIYE